jgi:hypothetical protein
MGDPGRFAAFRALAPRMVHQAHLRLTNYRPGEYGRAVRVAYRPGHAAQFVVDQGNQLIGGVLFAIAHLGE